ncbi:MAG: hypothetical protein A2599_00425 [Candidatus Staskawiczbacteria bacterium RIFOXYD1_FULL_39_28]|uniref:Uncharacterized protein n=1 Tax=Candidatus Staskawiczbacteria bacterium RIFOXYC1_FULL_38_18 TaxID=1802229 RepID=A0A1G2JFB2_9BACT|nr:MAG: hypothetical protein A2401_03140 [Candidatus Staskawiczbacteria bacterium RIFOXYC1_FULL_38_18]OGZ90397.1 MAG: hypothetical protein A2599_00425 [Candidatus Staskawiczbacteria bacterium RIFOXYD1_FULL_39_28]
MPKGEGESKQENDFANLSDEELTQNIEKIEKEIELYISMLMQGGVPNDEQRDAQRGGEKVVRGREELKAEYLEEYKKRTGKDYVFVKPESEK